ncbi:aminotransferase A [Peribacillus simplex]|uniref:Aminotransferase n=1 Tax=Peribacillus simplex TaxID=1478 RepID=A0AAW7IGZ6_9BACI|nr:aminotransferase A [Peribacillus simplex]AMM92279.1 aromatic amino acid aminotransferase [Peribacillus simplex]MDM5295648.1 aminotransferase A [Peribacillus simplex]MDM5454654.1 aminotransferase A [Peribacillus simplex]
MEHLINPLVKDVQISGIRKFYNMVADIEGTISLTIGQPDFPTPMHIKEAAKKAVDNDYTVYTHNAGYLELREAASEYIKDKYKLGYDPANEVIVTSGASEGIDITFRTILIPGNEVILPGPVYPGYEPIIKMCGATPIYADTTKNGFRLTADIIEKYITDQTRCIVLPYPSNPTGVTLSAEELLDIAELVKGKDIFILADEIYSELVFDQEHVSIATFLKEQTIVLNGLSKSHSMTGWRIGLLFAPVAISQHILKVHQYNVTCASSISQRAALAALTAGKDDAIPMKTEYARRRDYVYSRLEAMKLEIVKPNGAFYFFIKLPEGYTSSIDFCLDLVKQERVAVVPGDAFSPLGEGYFRISYAYSMETLEKALDRIEAFLS